MSERLKTTNVVSNEDVIDELTKDLHSSLHTPLDGDMPEENVINPGTSAGDAPFPTEVKEQPSASIPKGFDTDNDDEDDGGNSETDIDEEALKDAELDLTEDQKAERQTIAEELKKAGNDAFKIGEYKLSIEKYTEGLRTCPLAFSQQRSILYCNRSAAKMKLQEYKKGIKDCTKALELDDKYIKAYLRRAQCYESTEKFDESLADFKKILELDPTNAEAQKATIRLPPLIEEKNEKLKTEMMGKLKELGNMILKPFGLSTENFKLEQDPDSQGYKINFKQ